MVRGDAAFCSNVGVTLVPFLVMRHRNVLVRWRNVIFCGNRVLSLRTSLFVKEFVKEAEPSLRERATSILWKSSATAMRRCIQSAHYFDGHTVTLKQGGKMRYRNRAVFVPI